MRHRLGSRTSRPPSQRLLRIEHCERREMLAGDVHLEFVNLFDADHSSVTSGGTYFQVSGDVVVQSFDSWTAIGATPSTPLNSPQTYSDNPELRNGVGDAVGDASGGGNLQIVDLRQFLPDQVVGRHPHGQTLTQDHTASERVIDLAHVFSDYDAMDGEVPGQFPVERTIASQSEVETVAEAPEPARVAGAKKFEHAALEQSWAFELASVAEKDSQLPTPPAPVRKVESPRHTRVPAEVSDMDLSTAWRAVRDIEDNAAPLADQALPPVEAHSAVDVELVDTRDAALAEPDLFDSSPAVSWWSVALERRHTWAALAVGVFVALKTWGNTSDASAASREPRRQPYVRHRSLFLPRRT